MAGSQSRPYGKRHDEGGRRHDEEDGDFGRQQQSEARVEEGVHRRDPIEREDRPRRGDQGDGTPSDDQLPAGQPMGSVGGLEEKVYIEDGAEPHHGGQQVKKAGGKPDPVVKRGGNRARIPRSHPPGEKRRPGGIEFAAARGVEVALPAGPARFPGELLRGESPGGRKRQPDDDEESAKGKTRPARHIASPLPPGPAE